MNRGDHYGGMRKFMEESVHYRMQRNGVFNPPGCWALKKCRVENPAHPGCSPAARLWPADFDVFGTYLYGTASPYDGNYVQHRSQRGDAPQWGLGNHLVPIATGISVDGQANSPSAVTTSASSLDGALGRPRKAKLRVQPASRARSRRRYVSRE